MVLRDFVAVADPDRIVDVVLHSADDNTSAMPAYDKTLTREQVSDIIAYLRKAGGR